MITFIEKQVERSEYRLQSPGQFLLHWHFNVDLLGPQFLSRSLQSLDDRVATREERISNFTDTKAAEQAQCEANLRFGCDSGMTDSKHHLQLTVFYVLS